MAKKIPKKAAKKTPKKVRAVKKAIKKTAKKTAKKAAKEPSKSTSIKRKPQNTDTRKFTSNRSDITSTKAESEQESGLIEQVKSMLAEGLTIQEIAKALRITNHQAARLASMAAKQVRSEQAYKKGHISPEGDPPPWH